MPQYKLLLVAIGATLLLGALVTSASAGRLSSSSQTFRAAFPLARFAGAFGTTVCDFTLEGSFHSRTIAKTAGSLIGFVTRVPLGRCEVGSATVLTASLPWHVRYASFAGTLPNISAIATTITGAQVQIREPIFQQVCLASGGTLTSNFVREAGGALRFIMLGGSTPTNCGVNTTVTAQSSDVTVLGSAARVTVTLI
jgi:hypothetical protein